MLSNGNPSFLARTPVGPAIRASVRFLYVFPYLHHWTLSGLFKRLNANLRKIVSGGIPELPLLNRVYQSINPA